MKIPSTVPTPNILHDSLGRIVQDRGLSGGTFTHGYDEAGNRNSGSGNRFTYTSGTDKLTATNVLGAYSDTFDAAGNVSAKTSVSAITVADDGTVTGVTTGSGSTTWGRDYRGLRMERYGASGNATYFYDQGGEMISWTGPTSSTVCAGGLPPKLSQTTPFENYVVVGGLRIAIVKSHSTTIPSGCTGGPSTTLTVDDTQLLQNDKMGMPHYAYSDARGVTIWTGDFDAFGENIVTQNQDPDGDGVTTDIRFRLPGQFALTTAEGGPDKTLGLTGLVENWNRVYDTAIGRYLEPDPLDADRAEYTYVSSAPFAAWDPAGTDFRAEIGATSATFAVDHRNSCCSVDGSDEFRYSTKPTPPSQPWWQPSFPSGRVSQIYPSLTIGAGGKVTGGGSAQYPPISRDAPDVYCTTCAQDKAIEQALLGVVGARQPPYSPQDALAIERFILTVAGVTAPNCPAHRPD